MPEKVSESQTVFERAVHHHVSSALYSQLERIEEFQLGAVLVHHEKPHFWRKKELDFTGVPFHKLLQAEDASGLAELQTQSEVVFTSTDDRSTKKVDINFDLDGELKAAFLSLGGNLDGDAKKNVTIEVSLGAFKHITSNMYDVLKAGPLRIDASHPVVKDAMAKGKSLFFINSLYQSDKVEIKITETIDVAITDKTDEGNDGGTPTNTPPTNTDAAKPDDKDKVVEGVVNGVEDVVKEAAGKEVSGEGDEKAGVSSDANSIIITNRALATNIAFQVIKVDIGKNGVLVPQGRSGFDRPVKIHFPYGDTFAQITPEPSETEGGATGGATPTTQDNTKKEEPSKTDDTPAEADSKKDDDSKATADTTPKDDDSKDTQKTDDDSKDSKSDPAPEQ